MHRSAIRVDSTKILTRRELALVLIDLKEKAQRSRNARLNLILVRLACCCGLRASEIASLQVADVRTEISRPHLCIRRGASKGGRPRIVPLWWDGGTLADMAKWKAEQVRKPTEAPFIGSLRPNRRSGVLYRHTLRRRYQSAVLHVGPQ